MPFSQKFRQTTSLVARLRSLTLVVAVFFLIGFLGSYLSSRNFLRGLTEVNAINGILDQTNSIAQNMMASSEELAKLADKKRGRDVRYAFSASHQQALRSLQRAQEAAATMPDLLPVLKPLSIALERYGRSADNVLTHLPDTVPAVARELLVVQQFELEAKEALRRTQIELKHRSDQRFMAVYSSRNLPLIVAVILTTCFFVVVMIVGLGLTRSLARSIENLVQASEIIARGDLGHRAAILSEDEIGRLAFTFNQMIHSLQLGRNQIKQSADRIAKLQAVTASFSEAMRIEQVLEVIVRQGFDILDAYAGVIVLASEDGRSLEMRRADGYPSDVLDTYRTIAVDSDLPIAQAFRERRPVLVGNRSELQARYPVTLLGLFPDTQALAAVPLQVGNEVLGVLGLSFPHEHHFAQDEVDFMMSLARQCAQALHRSQLYEDAQDAIRARDEFLSIASHELRTPLTPLKLQIQGMLRQLRDGAQPPSTERLRQIGQTADRQIERLASLIEGLLDVSRISSGKFSLNRERFNLAEMIDEVVARYSQPLASVHASVDLRLDRTIEANLDRLRMEQVLINLLTNAMKYAPEHPIHIALQGEGDRLRLSVRDEGVGIAKEDQIRIFDRFERVGHSGNVGGLGLGLYISNQIVEAHGGRLMVESEVGKGSTFIVDLPLEEPAQVDPGLSRKSPSPGPEAQTQLS